MESNTPITPPGKQKFTPPPAPVFNTFEACLSALSLLGFLGASVWSIVSLASAPWWAVLPFWFTALGSGIGFLYETSLIVARRPYQLFAPPYGILIQSLRFGNLALVFGSLYLSYALLTFGAQGHGGWMGAVAGILTGFLLVLFLFQGPRQVAAAILVLGLIVQIALLYGSPGLLGGSPVRLSLTLAAIGLFSTNLIGAGTPLRSTIFHIAGTVVVALLYFGTNAEFSAYPEAQPLQIDGIGLRLWAAVPFGAFLAFRFVPGTWPTLRSLLANATWPLFYLIIAGGVRTPQPERLGKLYDGSGNQLTPLALLPYYIAHPQYLTQPISVPCLDEALTLKVRAFGFITGLVKFAFGAASFVNRFFPFANIQVPLAQKQRMAPWSDGSEYWPKWLLKRIYIPRLGWFSIESGVKGPGFQPTPQSALDAYQAGQLLAFLVECGIAGPFIEHVTRHGNTAFKLDFRFLEKYETKADYERYGGVAYFEIDEQNQCMKLTHVCAPGSEIELAVDVNSATFRHAEDMILASIYFYVVSGKHLVEIHMGLNLVEVALFNAFDARQLWFHPVRLALYPHLFAHELAEELTTQNLLEDRAVFPQIFATTNSALMRHLNDRFTEYQFARDEDFDYREQVLLEGRTNVALAELLPHCSLVWEKEYAAIWQEYATAIVDSIYENDTAVEIDDGVQILYANLDRMFQQPLPDRFHQFKTRKGLARFIADTMHHLIIRHEVYGTSGVRLALDPRINKVQVPKDGGTYAVDEWRSLACVAMATSRVRYTLLMGSFKHIFEDLKDPDIRQQFDSAYDQMMLRLQNLELQFTHDGVDNYAMLRPLPSELDIGAGY